MKYKFKIENTEIYLNIDNLLSNKLTLKSMPYNYEVEFVNSGRLKSEINRIKEINKDKHFVFIDKTVAKLYANVFFKSQDIFSVVARESYKSLPQVVKLLDKLQEKNITKKEIFFSVGGGITQDISAFVRAIYKRGIDWNYVPTTLLAMADSCIGAKSCLNYAETKNQLGLFSAPKLVYIDIAFLKTLDQIDVLSGYGEILKLAIVGGSYCIEKFAEITKEQKGDRLENIDQLIQLSLSIKKSVIEIDEYEKNIRRALNYGHTIGHAIEPLVDYKIPHGVAVSIGCYIENLISAKFGLLKRDEMETLNKLIFPFINKSSLKLLNKISIKDMIDNMRKDKKTLSNDIYIAVPFEIGNFNLLKITINSKFEKFLTKVFNDLSN